MLYNLFELLRDPNLASTSFGASESVGYDLGTSYRSLISDTRSDLNYQAWTGPKGWDGTLSVGLTLAFDGSPRMLPLYKSVELWPQITRGRRTPGSTAPVIVERLYYRKNDGYIPYCLRQHLPYISPQTLVNCDNLQLMHGELQNLTGMINLADPRQIYLETLAEARSWCPDERLMKLRDYVNQSNQNARFSRHVYSAQRVESLLDAMSRSLSHSFDPERTTRKRSVADVYEYWVEPTRFARDPITAATPVGGVSINQLMRHAANPPFDTSAPQALTVDNVDVTEINTKSCVLLAQLLDPVKLTDYKIEIKMINGVASAHHWEYAINRYAGVQGHHNPDALAHAVEDIYKAANLACRMVGMSPDHVELVSIHDFLNDARVVITKTYGEEILVELRCTNKLIGAWYIDTALLTFCSMGLSCESSLFPTDRLR